jgi:hypothetical protein
MTPLPTALRTNEAIRPAALKQELGAVRFVRKLLLKCEERVRNGHRPRSCSVGGSESSETWDNGISLVAAITAYQINLFKPKLNLQPCYQLETTA